MAGQLSDQEGYFLLIAREILEARGIYVSAQDEIEIRAFLRPGIRSMIVRPYSEVQLIEQNFRNRLQQVALPTLSIREILRRLCPCNPFC